MFIDTHCHIDDNKLPDKSAVVNAYLRDGVSIAINAGCNEISSLNGKTLSEQFESVYFCAGFHPSDAKDCNPSAIEKIFELCAHPKCVAVGEIGLDYYWDTSYNDIQKQAFIAQIELANERRLPISVHCREATKDTLDILKAHPVKAGGVMHCFSGSYETALELIKLGFYISFGGTLTFKNARNLVEIAQKLPLDKLLTETDSPYLAPTPFRGSINEPKNVALVTAKLAEIRALTVEQTAAAVMANAKKLFYKLK